VLRFTHLFLSSTELHLLVTRNRVLNHDKIEHAQWDQGVVPKTPTATGICFSWLNISISSIRFLRVGKSRQILADAINETLF